MNKQTLACLIVALSMFAAANINAQQRSADTHFGLVGHVGFGWDGRSQWQFNSLGPGSLSPLKKGFSFGGGIEYGPLASIKGTMLMTSLEVGYSQESSSINFSGGNAESKVRRMPVMVWAKLISEAQFSPFVRMGIGVARTQFSETVSGLTGQDFDFAKWHFSWGAGAGLAYQLNQQVGLEMFIDSWLSQEAMIGTNAVGTTHGFRNGFAMIVLGVRGVIAL